MADDIQLPPGVRLREFGDVPALRQDILDTARNEYSSLKPLENDQVRISVDNVRYNPKKKEPGIHDAKQALLTGGSLRMPLLGDVHMHDIRTGELLDSRKGTLLANIPYLTDRGTFVLGGNEVTNVNQSRLRSGVYSRQKANGELETHFVPHPGTGPQMRIFMEPETGVFRAHIGQSLIKLYPVLNALGVPDSRLEKIWGPGVLKENQMAYDKHAVGKFYTKFMGSRAVPDASDEDKIKQLHERLAGTGMDPEVTERTLGTPHDKMSPELLAQASGKLLRVARGEAEPDDRDSLANKYFMSTDDFVRERIRRDHGGMGRALLWKATRERNLNSLKPGYFTPQTEGLLVGNSLSSPISGINPMEVRDQLLRIVQTGEGGVGSQESISSDSRNVHPSQFCFIDPIRSSESTAIGTDQRLAHKVMKGSDGFIYAPFRNRKTGKIEYLNPSQASQKNIVFHPGVPLAPFGHTPDEPVAV